MAPSVGRAILVALLVLPPSIAPLLRAQSAPAADRVLPSPLMVDVWRAGPVPTACPAEGRRVDPVDSIQAAVEASAPGTTICIGAGRHRGQVIAPKDRQVFVGETGAVLDGTLDVAGFVRDGSTWIAPSPAPKGKRTPSPDGRCLPDFPTCDDPELAFLDGTALARAVDGRDLRPGQFAIDPQNRIRIADDPTGRRVSVSAAPAAFLAHGARDVTVSNLTIELYASPAQHGAIYDTQGTGADGWLIEHDEVRRNAGLGILAGPRARILFNRVEENGQLGISASFQGVAIENNIIVGNNTRGFDSTWEAGGLKATNTQGLIVRGNVSRGNHGPGLWCDIDCTDALFEGNLVEINDAAGIFYEISRAATIRDNTVRLNGRAGQGWLWGAGILLAASSDVVVEGNTVTVPEGGTGIALIDQGRRRDGGGYYRTSGNKVVGNAVWFTGPAAAHMGGASDVAPGTANDGVIEAGNNVFDRNTYLIAPGGTVRFSWGRGADLSFDGFQRLGQDRHSRETTVGSNH